MTLVDQFVIWKFPLMLVDEPQAIRMPDNSKVVHVADQNGVPTLWVQVHTFDGKPRFPLIVRDFKIAATGEEIAYPFTKHYGSCFFAGGGLVFHVMGRPEQ